ncbi:hypothetical protein F2Q68_00015162 [Brassica cretica]|uniref:Uncharacterized protein n=1 Tax=Brassica cretica TaxID=69181 RepID=A0A8S9HKE9_BRACR|nr:hypothetical protein F2Q68_00015162 [Brassica cretica]
MDSCRIDVLAELGRYVATKTLCKLAGFLKTLEYWQRDKFWDLVSRFLILCLEMLETSALGLGQDLGLLLVLEGAMTNSTYVSRFSFILIPYRFKVRDRCYAVLQGFSLNPAFEKHFGLSTDVRSQNCSSCLDFICDRGVRTKGSCKFFPGKRHPPILCFPSSYWCGGRSVVLALHEGCAQLYSQGRCWDVEFWFGLYGKALAEGQWAFIEIDMPSKPELSCFKMAHGETKPKSLDPEPVQSQFRGSMETERNAGG